MSEAQEAQERYQTENPFGNESGRVVAAPAAAALASVEQQREIAKVQAQMIVARRFPRDQRDAADRIIRECSYVGLAENARYSYRRGGEMIEGPTIDILETVARCWGNIHAGFKELGRHHGYSEVVAYAWDLETGTYEERQFNVPHWRDTKSGGRPVTDARDIYELIANNAQRRKRSCLESILPRHIVAMALEECDKTLKAKVDITPEAIKRLLAAFADEYRVSKEQIERWAGCRIEAIRPAQFMRLRQIYASIRDGMSEAEDWFRAAPDVDPEIGEIREPEPAKAGNAGLAAAIAPKRGRGRPRKDGADQQQALAAQQQAAADPEAPPTPAAAESQSDDRDESAEPHQEGAADGGGRDAYETLHAAAQELARTGIANFRNRWLFSWQQEEKNLVRQHYAEYEEIARAADKAAGR